MITQSMQTARLVVVRMNSGESVLEALQAAVKENGIRNGLILSGVGSLSKYNVHVVETTNLPPGDLMLSGEGPFDILAITGAILDGRVHAHITFSDKERAMGGHVHEGCTILTFGLAVIADTPKADLSDWDRMGRR